MKVDISTDTPKKYLSIVTKYYYFFTLHHCKHIHWSVYGLICSSVLVAINLGCVSQKHR